MSKHLTEGRMSKGGQNDLADMGERPPAPQGSGVPLLRKRTMTLDELQQRTLDVLRLVRRQFNRAAHEEGMSDTEFLANIIDPFKNDILNDRYMLKQWEPRP